MTGSGPTTPAPAVLGEWLIALDVARRQLRFYPEDHPAVAPAIADMVRLAADLPARSWLLQVAPTGFALRDGDLGAAGKRTQRLASQLFQLGVIGFAVRPPIGRESAERLLGLVMTLRDSPDEDDRERVLEEAEEIRGVELVTLDPSWFVLSDGIASGAVRGGGGLWSRLVERMTGGALVDGEGGGLSAADMAEMVDGAGDPFGFLQLLVDHVSEMLGEAEEGGAALDGLALLAGVDEMVRLVRPENQRELARLMVQHADPPGSLRSRLPEILSTRLFLDGVETVLRLGRRLPPAAARLLARIAEPDPDRPLSRRVTEATAEERTRARLLALEAGIRLGRRAPAVSLPYVEHPSMRRFLAEMRPAEDPAEEFDERTVRGRLDLVLRVAYRMWPRSFLAGVLGERLTASYFEHVELGELREAGTVARDLLAGEAPHLIGRITGRDGIAALLDALSVWGKDRRHDVSRIVALFGPRLVPALLEGVRGEESLSRRRRLLEMVVAVGPPAAPGVTELLDDRRWFVVRNAILLLRRLRATGVVERIAPLVRHDDPRVVSEAVRSLLAEKDARALEGIRRLVENDDGLAWREGLAIVSRMHHPEVGRMLARRLEAVRGGELRSPETVELIEVLGGYPQPEVVEQLRRLAGLAQWKHPFRLTPVWQAVAAAAARMGTDDGRRLLAELASLRDPAAETAKRLLDGGAS